MQPQPQPTSVHIPGLGPVQIMNAVPLTQNATQFAQNTQQIVNATPQFTGNNNPNQQALQQDPNDPSKWHVVQMATAAPAAVTAATVNNLTAAQPAQIASAPQTAQIVTANGTIIGSATIPQGATTLNPSEATVTVEAAATAVQAAVAANGQPQKTRLRRVACTCPNCKDGDRSRK